MADTTSPLPELPAPALDALLSELRVSSTVISYLPEDPGYNGSRLIIDDVEARRVAAALDAAVAALSALAAARPAEQAQKAAGEVGKIVLFGGDLKEVSWAKGRMPPVGTKLYASPQAAQAAQPPQQVQEGVAVAQVIEMEYDGLEARVRWLLNPMPVGALLYEATPAAQQPAAPEGLIEQIAQQWDGCEYDDGISVISIGQAIRDAASRLAASPNAPKAEQQGETR